MYVVQTADSGDDQAALRDAARDGRAAAMSRRRALAAGRSALPPAPERVRTPLRATELRAPAAAADATPAARLGRAVSMQRRRQLAQGKRALNGGGDRTAAPAGGGAPVFIVHPGGGR